MSVDIKTKELADAVKETEEYKNLDSAHARLQLDVAAQDIVSQIQSIQEQVEAAQMEGKPLDNSQIEQLKGLQVSAQQNETLDKLFKAQEAFNGLMQGVSDKISEELYKK